MLIFSKKKKKFRHSPLLCGKKLFRGLGGNFGVFSDGEYRGEVLVLLEETKKKIKK